MHSMVAKNILAFVMSCFAEILTGYHILSHLHADSKIAIRTTGAFTSRYFLITTKTMILAFGVLLS